MREVGGSLNRYTKIWGPGRGLWSAVILTHPTSRRVLEAGPRVERRGWMKRWTGRGQEPQVRVGIQEVESGVPGRIS